MADGREQLLIDKVRRGDQAALGEVLEMYQHRLYNVSLRMVGNRDDAAEITQDAMLKIIEHIADYNGACALSTWMIRICMNLSISHLRKRRLRQAASLEQEVHGNGWTGGGDDQLSPLRDRLVDPREPGPEACVQQREMMHRLQTALNRLDEEFRATLVLRDIDQMDYADIATALSVPVGTVKSRLFRARLALRLELQKLDASPAAPSPEVKHG